MAFKDSLKAAREKAGLSQYALAHALNVAPSMIGRYESSDVEPKASMIVKLAQVLNISTDELLGYSAAYNNVDSIKDVLCKYNYVVDSNNGVITIARESLKITMLEPEFINNFGSALAEAEYKAKEELKEYMTYQQQFAIGNIFYKNWAAAVLIPEAEKAQAKGFLLDKNAVDSLQYLKEMCIK